mmetsp:Transcript_63385/g.125370  ORF Transcript_63385/g.125370 Transcript_63385/m.125370 type:complete len:125 (+) Transcript_63385:94-468(+)
MALDNQVPNYEETHEVDQPVSMTWYVLPNYVVDNAFLVFHSLAVPIRSSSTSNTTAFASGTALPCVAKAKSGGMKSVARSPNDILVTPFSRPLMTCPAPTLNLYSSPFSRLEPKIFPLSAKEPV